MGGRVADANAAGLSRFGSDLMPTEYSLQLPTLLVMGRFGGMSADLQAARGRTKRPFPGSDNTQPSDATHRPRSQV